MVKGTIFSKFKGDRAPLPALPPLRSVALAWLGGVLAIATVGKLAGLLSMPLMLGSFGASCVLVFGYPDVPFSQPRNVVFGHFLSSLDRPRVPNCLRPAMVGDGIGDRYCDRRDDAHSQCPSASRLKSSDRLFSQPSWAFLLFPTLVGALLITATALLYNNVTREPERYPKYW